MYHFTSLMFYSNKFSFCLTISSISLAMSKVALKFKLIMYCIFGQIFRQCKLSDSRESENNLRGRGKPPLHAFCIIFFRNAVVSRKGGNVLFIDALKTFYLQLCGVGHMVKSRLDSERGSPLPPLRGLFFPISNQGSFICPSPPPKRPL